MNAEEHIKELEKLGYILVKKIDWSKDELRELTRVTKSWLRGYGVKPEPRHIRLFVSLVTFRVANKKESPKEILDEASFLMKRYNGNFKKVLKHWILKLLDL